MDEKTKVLEDLFRGFDFWHNAAADILPNDGLSPELEAKIAEIRKKYTADVDDGEPIENEE